VTVAYLASREAEVQAGYLVATFGIPAIGLIRLIIGLLQRSRGRPHPAPYPPPYQPPPGFPVNTSTAAASGKVGHHADRHRCTTAHVGRGWHPRRNRRIAARNVERPHSPGLLATDTSMRVGECISEMEYLARIFSSQPGNDCANGSNTFQLAFKGGPSDTCPDGKREHSDYSRYTDESTILCFALNLKQGECYHWNRDGETVTIDVGDCNDTRSAQVGVARRIDGSTDKTQCPPGGKAICDPVPPRVYCLVRHGS
jgi:hypothetical protein